MTMSNAQPAKALPMQLQANLAGMWKTILKFDANNTDAYVEVLEGSRLLH